MGWSDEDDLERMQAEAEDEEIYASMRQEDGLAERLRNQPSSVEQRLIRIESKLDELLPWFRTLRK